MTIFENKGNDNMIDLDYTYIHQKTIKDIKSRFSLYGYDEILTSTFSQYDLYAKMNGTVNHQEMIKTIDNTGQVLVLRPDVTIPLTERLARKNKTIESDLKYFYVLDVYRQSEADARDRETLQAGIEYFGNDQPEADGEVIALAADIFKQNNIHQFTIEIGHAGFFKELINELSLNEKELEELISYIRAKNVPDLERFTERIEMEANKKAIIQALPFLYGEKEAVLEKAYALPLNDKLRKTLADFSEIFDVLDNYDISQYTVIDLSLINHMDYYSDIIFQGFVKKVGKPVLMGGRYDRLSENFNAHIPAIGFAIDIPTLLSLIVEQETSRKPGIDCMLRYTKESEKEALSVAKVLRSKNYRTVTYPVTKENTTNLLAQTEVLYETSRILVDGEVTVLNNEDLIQYIEEKER